MGAIWVEQGFWNHLADRPYTAGDVITVFFAMLFGIISIAGLSPNIAAIVTAKAAGQRSFDVI